MTKFEPCVGATSDHAPRSIAVKIINPTDGSFTYFQGATWNMQIWCASKAGVIARGKKANWLGWDEAQAFGNNPMDVDEAPSDYFARKEQQIIELENIMNNGNSFIFLQETDWLNHPKLKEKFEAMFARKRWQMTATPGPEYQQLVTLTDMRKFDVNLRNLPEGRFKSDKSDKFRGFQTDFIDVDTQRPLSLVNLHLEYGHDYSKEMLALQTQFVNEDVPCIMGGDTNNVTLTLPTMIIDWNAATNISLDGNGGLTTVHAPGIQGRPPIQKAYDGFFVNPGKYTYAQITEMAGMRFNDLGNGQVAYVPYLPNPKHAHHTTDVGKPWMKRKALEGAAAAAPARVQPRAPMAAAPAPVQPRAPMAAAPTPPAAMGPQHHQIHLQPVRNYYGFAGTNRFHLFAVRHNNQVGDQAKATILNGLLQRINQCQSTADLTRLEGVFKSEQGYQVIITGQGLATKILGLQTDSAKAVEQMFQEANDQLNAPHRATHP